MWRIKCFGNTWGYADKIAEQDGTGKTTFPYGRDSFAQGDLYHLTNTVLDDFYQSLLPNL